MRLGEGGGSQHSSFAYFVSVFLTLRICDDENDDDNDDDDDDEATMTQ